LVEIEDCANADLQITLNNESEHIVEEELFLDDLIGFADPEHR
jgi:hypothetical protein